MAGERGAFEAKLGGGCSLLESLGPSSTEDVVWAERMSEPAVEEEDILARCGMLGVMAQNMYCRREE